MKRKKILVVTGTRADYGLLRSTMDAITKHPQLELRLLVTGMHTLKAYGNTKKEIELDGYHIDCTVPISPKNNMLLSLVQEIEGIGKYCLDDRPNCVVILGDRDEPFAAATVATHLNIPIAHIHGGDVTGPGVDEALRHSITKMAHIHFPGTKKSAMRLRAFGEEAWRIIEAGSVVLDVFRDATFIKRNELARELGLDSNRPWITLVQHPTAFDDVSLSRQISETLKALTAFPEYEKVILYPNSDTGSKLFIKTLLKLKGFRYHLIQSLPRVQYMNVLKESETLIGNSSSGIIEVSLLGTPSIDIGNRQKGRERGENVSTVPYDAKKIVTAIKGAIELKKSRKGKPFLSPYGRGNTGKTIAHTLAKKLLNPKLLHKKTPI